MTKRELMDTGSDNRYVPPGDYGRFRKSVDLRHSLASHTSHKAKNDAKPGDSDCGDHHPIRKH
ncbi:hypothetical protein [Rhizobium sp. RAF56]|uniref:hypothetical protein n=1 Tax=Rhizobium sp. RAF56 TaxID=3233062 RepID=UPI003F943191